MTVVLTEGDFVTGADTALADLVAEVRLRVAIKVNLVNYTIGTVYPTPPLYYFIRLSSYQQLKPIVQKGYTYCVETYNKTFNESEGQKEN